MTGKCRCSVFTKKLSSKKCCLNRASSCSGEHHENTLSACVHCAGASLANIGYSSFLAFLAFQQAREFLSAPKGSFRYLLQQLRNSFADVEISKPGELIHLDLSIIIIVRFVDVKQYSSWLWSRWRKSPSTLLLALSTKSSRIASFKLAMCLMSK